jgi:hypothetical protein
MLAADTRPAYFEFESAFSLADVLAGHLPGRRGPGPDRPRSSALLWLLAAGGAGGFLAAVDVLYNLQHGVWFASQRGLTELVRNLATGAGTVALFAWAWPRRAELLAGD